MARLDAHRGAEVLESEAAGKVKAVYEEIKTTFRAPTVGLVFRVLATNPDLLEPAWRQLKPNVRTVYFEERADALRARAVAGVANLGAPPRPPEDAVGAVRVFHYLNPKLLLAAAALRAAVAGSFPALQALSPALKREIAIGVPDGASALTEESGAQSDDSTAVAFESIKQTLGVSLVGPEYRVLAQWPEYLGWAWQSTRAVAGQEAYRALQRELRRMAEEALLSLPFRMDLNPHTLRLCGLSEADIDWARQTLDDSYRTLQWQVPATAFLAVGADGQYGSSRSPFPAQPQ